MRWIKYFVVPGWLALLSLGSTSLGSVALSSSVSPSSHPDASAAIASCTKTAGVRSGNRLSLAAVQACAPGGKQIAQSQRVGLGTYYQPTKHGGYQIVRFTVQSSVSAIPASGKAASASAVPAGTMRPAWQVCNFYTYEVIDGGGVIEWLGANMCANGYNAWAWNRQSNCSAFMFNACNWRTGGIVNSPTSNPRIAADPWENYYNTCWGLPCAEGIRLDMYNWGYETGFN